MDDQMSSIDYFQKHDHLVKKFFSLSKISWQSGESFCTVGFGLIFIVVLRYWSPLINSDRGSFFQITTHCWLTNTNSRSEAVLTHIHLICQQLDQKFFWTGTFWQRTCWIAFTILCNNILNCSDQNILFFQIIYSISLLSFL